MAGIGLGRYTYTVTPETGRVIGVEPFLKFTSIN